MLNKVIEPKSNWWVLFSIIFLVLASIVGFTVVKNNLEFHDKVNKELCDVSVKSLTLLRESVVVEIQRAIDNDEPPSGFVALDYKLGKLLIETRNSCSKET